MFDEIVVDAVEYVLETIIDGMIQVFAGILATLSASAAVILDMELVTNAILYTQGLAAAILVVKIAYEGLTTWILRTNGDPEADPGGVFLRACQSIFIITAVPWLVRTVYKFGTDVANDISSLGGVDYQRASNPFEAVWDMFVISSPPSILLFAIGLIFGFILFLIVVIQGFIRAGELAVIAASGSLMALGLSSQSSYSMFGTWWKELLSVSMTQAIQIFLIKLAFSALEATSNGSLGLTNNPYTNLMVFIGILWVTIKSPGVVRQYIHSSGTGKISGQVGSAMMLKKILSKGK